MSWDQRSGNKAGKIFFAGSFLVFALALLSAPSPPILRDYPDWVYQGVLFAKTLTGHSVAGYALKSYPVPNSITTVGLALLTVVLGWQLAAKLWLLLYLAFAAIASLYAGSVFRVKDAALWWVLPATLFLGQLFWFGTISFNLGLCLLIVIACKLYQKQERPGLFLFFLLTCFFIHMIVYASALLMVFLYCVQYRRWKLSFVSLATTPLVIWYFVGRALVPTGERDIGHSPLLHVALPCAAAAALLAIVSFKRNFSIRRTFGPVVVALSLLLTGAGLASAVIPRTHLSEQTVSHIFLLQLKAIQPFMLFGFVNISRYEEVHDLVISATLQLFREPLFLALMALDVLVSCVLLIGIGQVLIDRGDDSEPPAGDRAGDAGFLWDFVTLFALLYLACPPNALGVISIDMRLAQIGLAPALFLLAGRPKTALRFAVVPCAVLLLASVYQFAVSQHRVRLKVMPMNLPHMLDYFGAVDPGVSLKEYEVIRSGRLDHWIFPTGLFVETSFHGCCHDEPEPY